MQLVMHLYKDKVVTIIAYNKEEEEEANYIATIASKVYYIPMYKENGKLIDLLK